MTAPRTSFHRCRISTREGSLQRPPFSHTTIYRLVIHHLASLTRAFAVCHPVHLRCLPPPAGSCSTRSQLAVRCCNTSLARSAAAVRVSTPNFSNTCSKCFFTVVSAAPRMIAISGEVFPSLTQYKTFASLLVSFNACESTWLGSGASS